MHFTFKYIPHKIEKLQEYLDFLFYEVWLKAEGAFDAEKLAGHSELQKKYIDLGNSDSKWAYFFNSSIEKIYDEFLVLSEEYREFLKEKYAINNSIESLCTDKELEPITYQEIEKQQPNLAKVLKDFYSKLYGKDSPFNLKIFGFLNSELIADYDYNFMKENNLGICPYCGILHLKGNNHSYREAYDHYIPKGLYPFNVVNFRNLTPMCNECNSTYKLKKVPVKKIDPITKEELRTLAFYPYAEDHPKLQLEIKLKSAKINALKPSQIELNVSAEGNHVEQIDSWKRVFEIEERYKAILCNKNEGIAWFSNIWDEFENAKELSKIEDAETYYQNILKDSSKRPLANKGFIKSKFLEECKRLGLFQSLN